MGKEIACVLTFERIPMTSRDIRFGGQLADLISIISASCRLVEPKSGKCRHRTLQISAIKCAHLMKSDKVN